MDHNFRYKNFDLGISCRSWIKYDVFDETELYYGLGGNVKTRTADIFLPFRQVKGIAERDCIDFEECRILKEVIGCYAVIVDGGVLAICRLKHIDSLLSFKTIVKLSLVKHIIFDP